MPAQFDSPTAKARRPRRGPRKATADYLRNSALHYLERYATSSAHLRRLLMVKVARSAAAHETDAEAGAAEVEALIRRLEGQGLLDDAQFAQARARSLHRRGNSARAIRGALAEKGVPAETIEAALDALVEEIGEPDLAAALRYARRRSLGPYRAAPARAEMREKDLAALGRRGFGYDLARRVIDAEDTDDLEASEGAGRVG